MGRTLAHDELLIELARRRKDDAPQIVFTNGCFDILHVGHVRYLQDAKALGQVLVVGINADASVKRLKGPERPIQFETDRAEILAGLGAVDYVVIFTEDTPLELIEAIRPDVLVKGGDWPVDKIVGSPGVLARGGDVRSLPFHPGHSTTSLIARIDGR